MSSNFIVPFAGGTGTLLNNSYFDSTSKLSTQSGVHVGSGKTVMFMAKTSIEINGSFIAQLGSYFSAFCSDNLVNTYQGN